MKKSLFIILLTLWAISPLCAQHLDQLGSLKSFVPNWDTTPTTSDTADVDTFDTAIVMADSLPNLLYLSWTPSEIDSVPKSLKFSFSWDRLDGYDTPSSITIPWSVASVDSDTLVQLSFFMNVYSTTYAGVPAYPLVTDTTNIVTVTPILIDSSDAEIAMDTQDIEFTYNNEEPLNIEITSIGDASGSLADTIYAKFLPSSYGDFKTSGFTNDNNYPLYIFSRVPKVGTVFNYPEYLGSGQNMGDGFYNSITDILSDSTIEVIPRQIYDGDTIFAIGSILYYDGNAYDEPNFWSSFSIVDTFIVPDRTGPTIASYTATGVQYDSVQHVIDVTPESGAYMGLFETQDTTDTNLLTDWVALADLDTTLLYNVSGTTNQTFWLACKDSLNNVSWDSDAATIEDTPSEPVAGTFNYLLNFILR